MTHRDTRNWRRVNGPKKGGSNLRRGGTRGGERGSDVLLSRHCHKRQRKEQASEGQRDRGTENDEHTIHTHLLASVPSKFTCV